MQNQTYELEALFPVEPVPRSDAIVVPFEGDSDRSALRAALSGRKWSSISYVYMRANYPGPISEAFTYLTPRGKAYFLPTFLRICEDHPKKADDLPEVLLGFLVRKSSAKGSARDQTLLLLNGQQRMYFLRFLEARFKDLPGYADQLSTVRDVLQPSD